MLGIVFGTLIPTIVLSFFYHFIWFVWTTKNWSIRYPKWVPRSNSLWEAFYATFVMGLSFMILLAALVGITSIICKFSYTTSAEASARCSGRTAAQAVKAIFYITDNALNTDGSGIVTKQYDDLTVRPWFLIWLPVAAYLYQLEYLMKQRFIPWLKRKITIFKPKLSSNSRKA